MSIHRHGPRFPAPPVHSLRDEPKVADLAAERDRRRGPTAEELAARNQADVMASLVFPNLASSLTDRESEQLVAADLEDARLKLRHAFEAADRDSLGVLHARVSSLLAEVDQLRVDMAGGSAA
jgi:hypothetical protein